VGRTKRALNRAYQEMDRELGLDDIRRQLHNEEVMRSLEEHKKRLEAEILGKSKAEAGKADASSQATEDGEQPASTAATAVTESPVVAERAEQAGSGDISDTAPLQKDGRHE
ncbi:MAG: hypothetical protein M0R02_12655, partial [Bacteroidales bacterium]|nr:hypothetical protein [Bacteroidales bacterium]